MPARGPTRRRFLVSAAGTAAAAALGPLGAVDADEKSPRAALPTRAFGKTGVRVTNFGLGCYPLGALQDEKEAVRVIERAFAAGCNYIDTAPSYGHGASERRVGLALKQHADAKQVFLATKTLARTKDAAQRDLDGSLQRLGVERIDLVQIHAIKSEADLRAALDRKKGPLAALLEAREKKRIRFIGVTGHADPALMRKALESYGFDAILIPLNCVDPHYETIAVEGRPAERLSFLDQTLPAATKSRLARVAMKVFSSGRLVRGGIDPRDCLRFTYGLDVSTTVVGCKSVAEVDLAVEVARENKPLAPEARKALLAKTYPLRGKKTEWYKRS